MSDAINAWEHIATQVFREWRPPSKWDNETTVEGSLVIPDDWLDTRFWLDIAPVNDWSATDLWQVAKAAVEHFSMLRDAEAHYLPFWHRHYPALLRFIPDPPLALSVIGDVKWLAGEGVAIVGSRKASGRAVVASVALGKKAALADLVVVSGGALGCDIAAHWGVLEAGRSSAVVVFAGGLRDLYPRRNKPVFDRLQRTGAALISERLWSADSRPADFPVRNRIISGMARTTFVMQAGRRSGAYITARWALDQGREVVVLEHPETDLRALGSRELLDDGAIGMPDVSLWEPDRKKETVVAHGL